MPSTPTAQQPQPIVFRSLSEAGTSSSTSKSKGTGRPRGRPRKNPVAPGPTAPSNQRFLCTCTSTFSLSLHFIKYNLFYYSGGNCFLSSYVRKWAGRKSDSEETDSGDSEDDDDDENSSDAESLPKGSSPSKNGRDIVSATAQQAAFQFNAVQPNFYQEIGGQNNSTYQIQINLPPETAPSESDKIGNGQEKEVAPSTAHHANNDDDDYDT